jgi:predicted nucleotidyltransferase
MTIADLHIAPNTLAEFCRRWKIQRVELFGSAIRGELQPESDIDLMVTYTPDARWNLFDEGQMIEELEELFQRPVDLLSRPAVEASHNPIRREAILTTAIPIYDAP